MSPSSVLFKKESGGRNLTHKTADKSFEPHSEITQMKPTIRGVYLLSYHERVYVRKLTFTVA